MSIQQQINHGPAVTESGNYGYALGEAAVRWGMDEKVMFDHVNQGYKGKNIMPVCVLCENPCQMKLERNREMWHCNGFTLSAQTIGKFPKR